MVPYLCKVVALDALLSVCRMGSHFAWSPCLVCVEHLHWFLVCLSLGLKYWPFSVRLEFSVELGVNLSCGVLWHGFFDQLELFLLVHGQLVLLHCLDSCLALGSAFLVGIKPRSRRRSTVGASG